MVHMVVRWAVVLMVQAMVQNPGLVANFAMDGRVQAYKEHQTVYGESACLRGVVYRSV